MQKRRPKPALLKTNYTPRQLIGESFAAPEKAQDPGQRHDSKTVPELFEVLQVQALLVDKAYDSDKSVHASQKRGMQFIILTRVNRKKLRILDLHRYKACHLVENHFQRMNVFRRIATRVDKRDFRFLGFVHIASIIKWLH